MRREDGKGCERVILGRKELSDRQVREKNWQGRKREKNLSEGGITQKGEEREDNDDDKVSLRKG